MQNMSFSGTIDHSQNKFNLNINSKAPNNFTTMFLTKEPNIPTTREEITAPEASEFNPLTGCLQDPGYDIRLDFIKQIMFENWLEDEYPNETMHRNNKSTQAYRSFDSCWCKEWQEDVRNIYNKFSKNWLKFLNRQTIKKIYSKYYKHKWIS